MTLTPTIFQSEIEFTQLNNFEPKLFKVRDQNWPPLVDDHKELENVSGIESSHAQNSTKPGFIIKCFMIAHREHRTY